MASEAAADAGGKLEKLGDEGDNSGNLSSFLSFMESECRDSLKKAMAHLM